MNVTSCHIMVLATRREVLTSTGSTGPVEVKSPDIKFNYLNSLHSLLVFTNFVRESGLSRCYLG